MRALIICLLASSAVAQVQDIRYKTTAAITYYLDPAGSDAKDCKSPTTACQTIMGLKKKIPKVIRHGVTIQLADGNYAGGWLSGFEYDPQVGTDPVFIAIKGNLNTAVPTTGPATGTATSAVACILGPPLIDSSLTVSSATWTINDLRGLLIETTGGTGSGQIIPIASNTATSITLGGCWGVTPDATTTFAIRTWGAVINANVTYPADYINGTSSVGLMVHGLKGSPRSNNGAFFFLDQVKINTTANALTISDSLVYVRRCRLESTAFSMSVVGDSRINFQSSVAISTNSAVGATIFEFGPYQNGPSTGLPVFRIVNAYLQSSGVGEGILFETPGLNITNATLQMLNASAAVAVMVAGMAVSNTWLGLRIQCQPGSTTIGIRAENANNGNPVTPSTIVSIMFDSGAIRDCGTAIQLSGPNIMLTTDDSTFTATSGSVALSVAKNAQVNLDSNTTATGFSNQILLDGVPGTFASVLSTPNMLSSTTRSSIISIP